MKYKILILSLIAIFVLSGCSSNDTNDKEIQITTIDKVEETNTAVKITKEEEKNTTINSNSETEVTEDSSIKSPNFSSEKIFGQISKVIGNMVTLQLFVLPERSGDRAGFSPEDANTQNTETTTSPLTATTAPIPGQGGGGRKGEGTAMFTAEKSGETVDLVIVVGTEIKLQGDAESTFEIADLVKGMNIMVFVDSELTNKELEKNPDSKTVYAESIRIMQN